MPISITDRLLLLFVKMGAIILGHAMKPNLKSHISIAEQIVEGSLIIKTVAEFRSILKIFPSCSPNPENFYRLLIANYCNGELNRQLQKKPGFFTPICRKATSMKRP